MTELLLAWRRGDESAFDRLVPLVVEMCFFGGLTAEETAEALGASAQTVVRDGRIAKAWLLRELQSSGSG